MLSEIQRRHPRVTIVCDADDTYFHGPPDALYAAYEEKCLMAKERLWLESVVTCKASARGLSRWEVGWRAWATWMRGGCVRGSVRTKESDGSVRSPDGARRAGRRRECGNVRGGAADSGAYDDVC